MSDKVVKGTLHSGKGNRKHNDHLWKPEEERDVIVTTYVCTVDLKKPANTYDMVENTVIEMERQTHLDGTCMNDEVKFYETLYGETYRQQMKRYRKKGNTIRLKSFEDWIKCKNYSPVEDIIQIGKKGCPVPDNVLDECLDELMKWEHEMLGRNFATISVAKHKDETTYHGHKRDTYIYWDAQGMPHPCIKKALKQAGIPLPNPNAEESQYNNRKKTYDTMRRNKFYDIIEKHLPKGYVLDRTPDKDREFGHVTVDVFKAIAKKEEALDERARNLDAAQMDQDAREWALDAREAELDAREAELDAREAELNTRDASQDDREATLNAQADKNKSEAKEVLKSRMRVSAKDKKVEAAAESVRQAIAANNGIADTVSWIDAKLQEIARNAAMRKDQEQQQEIERRKQRTDAYAAKIEQFMSDKGSQDTSFQM